MIFSHQTSGYAIAHRRSCGGNGKVVFYHLVFSAAIRALVIKIFKCFKPLFHCQIMPGAYLFCPLILPMQVLFHRPLFSHRFLWKT